MIKRLGLTLAVIGILATSGIAQTKQTGLITGTTEGFKFSGLVAGVNAIHPATEVLWKKYDRDFYVTSGFTWRKYFVVSARYNVPVYRAKGVGKNTYIVVDLGLKLF